MRLLRERLARGVSSEATRAHLVADAAADGSGIGRNTVCKYLVAVTLVFALEEVPAWTASLRPGVRLPAVHSAREAIAEEAAEHVTQTRLRGVGPASA